MSDAIEVERQLTVGSVILMRDMKNLARDLGKALNVGRFTEIMPAVNGLVMERNNLLKENENLKQRLEDIDLELSEMAERMDGSTPSG